MKSKTFSDMFAASDNPDEDGPPKEGFSTENPIVIEDVSAADFESLLTVLYAT